MVRIRKKNPLWPTGIGIEIPIFSYSKEKWAQELQVDHPFVGIYYRIRSDFPRLWVDFSLNDG